MTQDLSRTLAIARIAVGVGTWLAPGALAAALRESAAAPSPYLLRLFATREAALGVVTLLADNQRAALLRVGLLVDGLDAIAGLLASRNGPRGGPRLLTAVAAGGILLGGASLRQARRHT